MKKSAILKNSQPPKKLRLLKPTALMLLLFLLFSVTGIAQNITIKGRVLKDDGTPVAEHQLQSKELVMVLQAMTREIFRFQPPEMQRL